MTVRAIDWDAMIADLEEQKASVVATIDEKIAAARLLAGSKGTLRIDAAAKPKPNGKAARKAAKPKAKKAAAASPARAEGDEQAAKALELWKRGKFVTEIATELGVSGSTIYYWKKRDGWPSR